MRFLWLCLTFFLSALFSSSNGSSRSSRSRSGGRGGGGGSGGGGGGSGSGRGSFVPKEPETIFYRGKEIILKMNSTARCTGIKQSAVTMEGKSYSSTKFFILADVADNSAGDGCGMESRPFTFGDSNEWDKWKHLKAVWPEIGIMVDCTFDVVAAADGKTKLTLLDIKPARSAASTAVPKV